MIKYTWFGLKMRNTTLTSGLITDQHIYNCVHAVVTFSRTSWIWIEPDLPCLSVEGRLCCYNTKVHGVQYPTNDSHQCGIHEYTLPDGLDERREYTVPHPWHIRRHCWPSAGLPNERCRAHTRRRLFVQGYAAQGSDG